jgi:predicted ATPase
MIRRIKVKGYKSLQDIDIKLELLAQDTARFRIEVEVELCNEVREHTERIIKEMRAGLSPEGQGTKTARRRVLANLLRYLVEVEMTTSTGHLRVVDERLEALTSSGEKTTRRRPFIEKGRDDRLHLRMEGQSHPFYHDIGLDHTLLSTSLYPPHYPHITAFREELSRWHFYYLEPNSMRKETPLKEVDNIGSFGSDLAGFYNSLKSRNEKQFEALNRAIRQLVPTIEKVDVERTKEGFLQLQIWEQGVPFSSRVISEGTLRVLALVAITNSLLPATVIGSEEPENGVHPRRMRLIAELLKDTTLRGETQIIVNTHSPILPEYFFEDAYILVCTKANHASHFKPLDTAGPLFRKGDVERALEQEPLPSLSQWILRGDYGG